MQIAISGPKAGERVPDFGSLLGTMLLQQLAGRGVEAGVEGGGEATREVRNRWARGGTLPCAPYRGTRSMGQQQGVRAQPSTWHPPLSLFGLFGF